MGHYQGPGDRIDYTPGSAVAAATTILVGNIVGVATSPIPANTLGSLAVEGCFDFPKAAGSGISQGALIYWDDTNKRMTTTASGNTLCGKCARTAASADVWVRCLLRN